MTAVLEQIDTNYIAFKQELEDARKPRHSGMHPFSAAWSEGKLTTQQYSAWAKQHYYYIEVVGQMFGMMYIRAPHVDTRLHVLENLAGEEIMGKRHPDLLLDFAEACGMNRNEILDAEVNGEILPTTRAMRSWILELGHFRPLEEAGAGVMVGLEGQLPTMYTRYVNIMRQQGFTDEQLKFFHVHIEGDEEHAENGIQLAYRYADTPEKRRRAVAVVRASTEVRWNYLTGMYKAIVLGEDPYKL
jgi:pyrroloquinoline-quinone synthase